MLNEKRRKLILGTVQLGLSYGYEKNSYAVNSQRAHDILDEAHDLGIETLDTALGYGQSHAFIGEYHRKNPAKRFRVYSKARSSDSSESGTIVDRILRELEIDRLEGLFLHDAKDKSQSGFMATLSEARAKGQLRELGISLYHDEEPQPVESDGFQITQIAFNPLDHAQTRSREIAHLHDRLGLRLFTRSCFLRGAVFHDYRKIAPEGLHPAFVELNRIAAQEGVTLPALCLNYCLQTPALAQVIVGVDHRGQLAEILRWAERDLSADALRAVEAIRIPDPKLLNLRNWP